MCSVIVFFFQAEDGIRYLVRSRGLGDVYKRQGDSSKRTEGNQDKSVEFNRPIIGWLGIGMLGIAQICHEFKITSHHSETKTAFRATAVSYTHLTLPTSDLV